MLCCLLVMLRDTNTLIHRIKKGWIGRLNKHFLFDYDLVILILILILLSVIVIGIKRAGGRLPWFMYLKKVMATSDKPATTEEAYRELEKARSNEDVSFGMKMILSGLKLKFPDVRDISTASLTSLLEASPENVVLLDCRDDMEFAVSHLDGSIRVDFKTEDVKGLVGTVPALNNQNDLAEKTVVCYCSLGYRSSAMAQKLSAFFSQQSNKGPKGVYNLEGSIFKWANESRPMVDSSGQPTIFAHPYNQVWGKVLSKHLRKEEP